MAPAAITSPATFLPDDLKLNSILKPPKVAGPRISASKGAWWIQRPPDLGLRTADRQYRSVPPCC